MGTRHLIVVMVDQEYKIAQYGQWDGHPSGQGITVLEFIRRKENIDKLSGALKRVRFLEPEGRDKKMFGAYEKAAPEWSSDPDNRTKEQKKWFGTYMSRNIGGEILLAIANSEDPEIIIRNSIDFAGVSLFCEYAYVVDLDKGTFEIYKGFNKQPITEGRFVTVDYEREHHDDYEPVKLVKTYVLDSLPTNESFIADLEPSGED